MGRTNQRKRSTYQNGYLVGFRGGKLTPSIVPKEHAVLFKRGWLKGNLDAKVKRETPVVVDYESL